LSYNIRRIILIAVQYKEELRNYREEDRRGNVAKHITDKYIINYIKKHIEKCPVIELHYSRKTTKKCTWRVHLVLIKCIVYIKRNIKIITKNLPHLLLINVIFLIIIITLHLNLKKINV